MPVLPNAPKLSDIQTYVTQLEKERGFADDDVIKKCLLLSEEVGELFKAVRKSEAQMGYATKDYVANPAEEIADILIVLSAIANRLGIDIEQAFRNKEIINHKRTWQ